jgi:hypothetical protein
VFRSAGFRSAIVGEIVQQVAASWPHYATRIATGADSVLASLNAEQFHAGLRRLRDYAIKHASAPVTETIDDAVPAQAKLRLKSPSIARAPFSRSLRVPVPVKCGCVITGSPAGVGVHASPVQVTHLSLS